MAHSPHRRWKGCPVCAPHKMRGKNRDKDPFRVQRMIGRKRRITRKYLGD